MNKIINTQDAMDAIDANVGILYDSPTLVTSLKKMVNALPPVDAVPVRHGRWIIRTRHEHYPSGRAYEELVCPFCGKVDHNGDGNFCGYCGARMDGKGDSSGRIQKCNCD